MSIFARVRHLVCWLCENVGVVPAPGYPERAAQITYLVGPRRRRRRRGRA